MRTIKRDLAEHDLWVRSLERSLRRRELAPLVRKTATRRRRVSLAVSAAVATAPVAPSLAFGGASRKQNGTDSNPSEASFSPLAHHKGPVLLSVGITSPAVAQVQRKVHVVDDSIYGPITAKAVRAFQERHGLRATGEVDVRTWLTLFPNDAIVSTPQGWGAQTVAPAADSTSSAPSVGVEAAVAGGTQTPHAAAVVHAAAAAKPAPSTGKPGTAAAAPKLTAAHAGLPEVPASPEGSAPVQSSTGTGGSVATQGSQPSAPAPQSQGDVVPWATTSPAPPPTSAPSVPQGPASGTTNELINRMILAANQITAHHYAYSWGGGHNGSFSGPYDCSGAVSAVLHAAGLLHGPMVSGDFAHWGAPGAGQVTIYANAEHVYMAINGRFFGTSGSNPGGGAAWFHGAPRPGFAVVHVPFERMHLRSPTHVQAAGKRSARRMARMQVAGGGVSGQKSTAAAHASDQTGGVYVQDSGPPPAGPSAAGTAGSGSGGAGQYDTTPSGSTPSAPADASGPGAAGASSGGSGSDSTGSGVPSGSGLSSSSEASSGNGVSSSSSASSGSGLSSGSGAVQSSAGSSSSDQPVASGSGASSGRASTAAPTTTSSSSSSSDGNGHSALAASPPQAGPVKSTPDTSASGGAETTASAPDKQSQAAATHDGGSAGASPSDSPGSGAGVTAGPSATSGPSSAPAAGPQAESAGGSGSSAPSGAGAPANGSTR